MIVTRTCLILTVQDTNEGTRTVVGRGEKRLLCDPGSVTAMREREKKGGGNTWDEEKKMVAATLHCVPGEAFGRLPSD